MGRTAANISALALARVGNCFSVCSKMMIMDLDYFIDICLAGDCHSDLLPVHAKLSANSLKNQMVLQMKAMKECAELRTIFHFSNLNIQLAILINCKRRHLSVQRCSVRHDLKAPMSCHGTAVGAAKKSL